MSYMIRAGLVCCLYTLRTAILKATAWLTDVAKYYDAILSHVTSLLPKLPTEL